MAIRERLERASVHRAIEDTSLTDRGVSELLGILVMVFLTVAVVALIGLFVLYP